MATGLEGEIEALKVFIYKGFSVCSPSFPKNQINRIECRQTVIASSYRIIGDNFTGERLLFVGFPNYETGCIRTRAEQHAQPLGYYTIQFSEGRKIKDLRYSLGVILK